MSAQSFQAEYNTNVYDHQFNTPTQFSHQPTLYMEKRTIDTKRNTDDDIRMSSPHFAQSNQFAATNPINRGISQAYHTIAPPSSSFSSNSSSLSNALASTPTPPTSVPNIAMESEMRCGISENNYYRWFFTGCTFSDLFWGFHFCFWVFFQVLVFCILFSFFTRLSSK